MAVIRKLPANTWHQPVEKLAELVDELAGSHPRSIIVIVDADNEEWPDLYAYGPDGLDNGRLLGHLAYASSVITRCRDQQDSCSTDDE